jgi:hypothetical protein
LIDRLEKSGQKLGDRLAQAGDNALSRRQIRHIIGIERWGQRRLRTFLGESAVQDEYDGYRPAETLSWEQYRDAFHQTRAETVSLARQLQTANLTQTKVAHNTFGDLTPPAWLEYLASHATREAQLIR